MQIAASAFTHLAVTDVVQAIQLSLAPVFLLNGIGVMLGMLTSRLARIVDRARTMEQRLPMASEVESRELRATLAVVSRRARLMNRAITLGTVSALLVALVVGLLFAAAFVPFAFGATTACVFILSMLSLVGALWCFLIEIRIATANLRFGSSRT